MAFITVFAGLIGLTDIGWKFWLWVSSGNIVAVIFVFFLCPETGGKTLKQVDFLFTKGPLAFKSLEIDDVEGNGEEKRQGGTIEVENFQGLIIRGALEMESRRKGVVEGGLYNIFKRTIILIKLRSVRATVGVSRSGCNLTV